MYIFHLSHFCTLFPFLNNACSTLTSNKEYRHTQTKSAWFTVIWFHYKMYACQIWKLSTWTLCPGSALWLTAQSGGVPWNNIWRQSKISATKAATPAFVSSATIDAATSEQEINKIKNKQNTLGSMPRMYHSLSSLIDGGLYFLFHERIYWTLKTYANGRNYVVIILTKYSLLKLSFIVMLIKPASDYKLIRRFRLSRRCRSSCRDFRLATGTLRLADYLGRARSDWQLIIGHPSAN